MAASPGGTRKYISGSFHDGVTTQMYSSYFTEEEQIRGTAEADEVITGWSSVSSTHSFSVSLEGRGCSYTLCKTNYYTLKVYFRLNAIKELLIF